MNTLDIYIEKGRKEGMEKGMEKGAEQKSHEFVKNLLSNTNFDIAKIAALADVPESFVKKIRTGLQKKK
jgi:hypothetical protein